MAKPTYTLTHEDPQPDKCDGGKRMMAGMERNLRAAVGDRGFEGLEEKTKGEKYV